MLHSSTDAKQVAPITLPSAVAAFELGAKKKRDVLDKSPTTVHFPGPGGYI